MAKRIIILIVVVVALGLGVRSLLHWRAAVQQKQDEQFARQINDADPYLRLLAAEGLLRHEPGNEANRLIRAKALIELNRHAEAREELQELINLGTPALESYVALQIGSFFSEADRLVGVADRQRSDSTIERIETMMGAVQAQSKLITGSQRSIELSVIDARRLDALASAYRFAYQGRQIELTKARIGGIQQTIETVGMEVIELAEKLKKLDDELIRVCARIAQAQPQNHVGSEMLFRGHLRRQEFLQARDIAKAMVSWKAIPTSTVARVADTLLDMETRFGEPITKQDIATAGDLLSHPNQIGDKGIDYQLAQAAHALAREDAQAAMKLAQAIVAKEWLHARALCIAARARIIAGDPMRGVEILQKYTELKRDPLVRYTLGLAYLATGEAKHVSLGQEALRQCLDIEPNHLPARLRLIESFVDARLIIEAAQDIQIVEHISPHHPRVLGLKAELAVESEDLASLGQLLDSSLNGDAALLRAEDVVLVIGMVLDDVPRVRRLAQQLKQLQPHDVIVMIADRWMQLPAMRRARIAPVVARHLHDYMVRDPLTNPLRPAVPVIGILARGEGAAATSAQDVHDPLLKTYIMPRPLDVALELATLGLDRWPQNTGIISAGAEVNIWLNQIAEARRWLRRWPPIIKTEPESFEALATAYLDGEFESVAQIIAAATLKNHGSLTPTHRLLDLDLALRSQDLKKISDSLQQMLQNHPWAEQALLMVVDDAMRREQPDRAFATLGSIEQINPQVASLTRGRLNLGLGRAADALHDIEKVVAIENAGTEVRRWAAEVRIRAHLLLDQQSLALGVCDQLQISLRENKIDASIATADVLLMNGKQTAASEVLAEIAANQENSLHTIDQVLARAVHVMKPSRIRALVEALLTYRPNDPVLLLYQAEAIAPDDDLVSERILKAVIARHPQSPRALMEMASLMRKVQPDEAVRIYQELSKVGGRTGETAQRLLEEMTASRSKPSSSASVEGISE